MEIRKPNRVSRTFKQRIFAPPSEVFPLLCPVREMDWANGWNPIVVFSNSGLAELDCIFVTRAEPVDAIWCITKIEPENGFIEMLKITPEVTACKLTVQLHPIPEGTEGAVTYSHTSLGPRGDAFVAAFSEDFYTSFMQEWESEMNTYLRTGEKLSSK